MYYVRYCHVPDFPGGPVVKNSPATAWGTKISHAAEQPSPHATMKDPA